MKKIVLILSMLTAFCVQAQSKQDCTIASKIYGSWVLNDMTFDYPSMSKEEQREAQSGMKAEVSQMIGKVKFIFVSNGVMRGESAIEAETEYSEGTWKMLPGCKQVSMRMDDEEEETYEIVSVDAKKLILKRAMEEDNSFSLVLLKE